MRQTPTEPRRRALTPEMLERRRAISKALWADPAIEAKMRTALSSPARRAKLSEATKARWADPATRKKIIADIRAGLSDPVVRQKRAVMSKERWADPAIRQRMIAGMRTTTKRRRNRDAADC